MLISIKKRIDCQWRVYRNNCIRTIQLFYGVTLIRIVRANIRRLRGEGGLAIKKPEPCERYNRLTPIRQNYRYGRNVCRVNLQ